MIRCAIDPPVENVLAFTFGLGEGDPRFMDDTPTAGGFIKGVEELERKRAKCRNDEGLCC